jgi:hypothetical protein
VTPIPLNLPMRAADAAELGRLIFEHAEPKPLTPEIRGRLASRAAALPMDSVTPFFGSLVRDPVHPSVYYLAVDASAPETGVKAPLLLHLAPAVAPTSSVFHKPLLIGRVRTAAGRELVINALPFGPKDCDTLDRFAAELDTGVLPQARGLRPAIAVTGGLPNAFAAFRQAWKRTGANLAAVTALADGPPASEVYYASLCAAIREGWREGYSARVEIRLADDVLENHKEAIRRAAQFSHFAIDMGRLLGPKGSPGELAALRTVIQAYETIRQTRSALRIPRAFDFEFSLEGSPRPVSAADLALYLDRLKEAGCPAQFVRPPLGSDIPAMTAIAREAQCLLSLRERPQWEAKGTIYYQLAGEPVDISERIALAARTLTV